MSASVGITPNVRPVWWTHQRKIGLAGSRVISVHADASGAIFSWSSTRSTFNRYSTGDIAGWSRGSFALAQDSAGVWRIVTVWRQTGTGGGRADGAVYLMAGSLSSDLSTLAWGSAVLLDGATGSIGPTYPDVDLVPDGTGLLGLAVWPTHDAGWANATVKVRKFAVSVGGTLSPDAGAFTLAGPYPSSIGPAQVSVAFDPTTKNPGVAYSAGYGGGLGGTHFVRGTYSGGNITWVRLDRTIDANVWALSDPFEPPVLNYAMQLRFDVAKNEWIIGGPEMANYVAGSAVPVTRFWRRDAADTGTVPLFSSASSYGMGKGGWAIDPVSSDLHLFGARNDGQLWHRKLTREADDTVTDEGTDDLGPNDAGAVAAWASQGEIHLIYAATFGTASPYVVIYDRLTTPVPPSAPLLLAPTGGQYLLVDSPQTFTIQFASPQSGDGQSAIEVQHRELGDTVWETTGWVPTPAGHVTFPGSTFTDGITYEWRARTKGLTGLEGPFSGAETFIGLGAPADLTITSPANASTAPAVVIVQWSVSDQDAYQVRVTDDDAAPTNDIVGADGTSDTGEIVDSTIRTHQITFVDSGVSRHIEVRAKNVGVWGDWVSVQVNTSFVIPGNVITRAEATNGYILVSIENQAGEGGLQGPPGSDEPIRLIDFGNPSGGEYET